MTRIERGVGNGGEPIGSLPVGLAVSPAGDGGYPGPTSTPYATAGKDGWLSPIAAFSARQAGTGSEAVRTIFVFWVSRIAWIVAKRFAIRHSYAFDGSRRYVNCGLGSSELV